MILGEVVADLRGELGPPTDEETAWARSVLGSQRPMRASSACDVAA